jgi:hypothetical protein
MEPLANLIDSQIKAEFMPSAAPDLPQSKVRWKERAAPRNATRGWQLQAEAETATRTRVMTPDRQRSADCGQLAYR